jgi:hypothetical protein
MVREVCGRLLKELGDGEFGRVVRHTCVVGLFVVALSAAGVRAWVEELGAGASTERSPAG